MKQTLALLAPFLLSFSVFAAIVRVPEDQPTIQAGIGVALPHDTILVSPGVYSENVDIYARQLTLASYYILSSDSADILSTIINGGGTASAVTIRNVADSAVWLIGFTIRNGTSGVSCSESGPVIAHNVITENGSHGIYCYESSPTISDNLIAGNTGTDGAGVGVPQGGEPLLMRNVIRDNIATHGGGVFGDRTSLFLQDNRLINNRATYGGAVYLGECTGELVGNVIDSNQAQVAPGIQAYGSSLVIDTNAVRYNAVVNPPSVYAGGGIHLTSSTTAIISRNEITGNGGPKAYGGGIYAWNACHVTIRDNLIDYNLAKAGGGIYSSGPSTWLWVINNQIENNNADSLWGGGVEVSNGVIATIDSNTIHSNYSVVGGGIFCTGETPLIRHNDIRYNIADGLGGGIRMFGTTDAEICHNNIVENESNSGGGVECETLSDSYIDSNLIADNVADSEGGGLRLVASSSLNVRANAITDNEAHSGAGIFCHSLSGSSIRNNQILGNRATYEGGGLHCEEGSDPSVRQNTFRGNFATYRGGAVLTELTDPTIDSCLIEENESGEGGGLFFDGGSPVLATSCVARNRADAGAGLFLALGSTARLGEVTFAGNAAAIDGGAVLCQYSEPIISKCILWADSAADGAEIYVWGESGPSLSYCDVAGGWDGLGIIDTDPQFCNPEAGNFHLASTSPCLDVGPFHFEIGGLDIGCVEPSCCDWRVGDANGVGGDEPTIGDVASLIDAKFITVGCDGLVACLREGDVNQSGGLDPSCADITIGDISTLIDYLFITGSSLGLPACM